MTPTPPPTSTVFLADAELRQGSEQWLTWRQAGVGASDAPVIYHGRSAFGKTVLDLFKTKTTPSSGKGQDNYAMSEGRRTEPASRAWFEAVTGLRAAPVCCYRTLRPWQKASLDGWVDGTGACLEVKYARREWHALALEERAAPGAYVPQLWHQMLVTDTRELYYVSHNPRFPARDRWALVRVTATDAELAELDARECVFWDCVRAKEPHPSWS